MHEIILPDDVKPALEWVNNRVLQKVSPQGKHALAQRRFAAALGAWADARGSGLVGTEWRFQLQPPREIRRSLVPDVAFLSYDRMPIEEQEATDVPSIAPDVVVEVLSPDDRPDDVEDKLRVYLATGVRVIFLVDPDKKTVTVQDAQGVRVVGERDTLEHAALPGFTLPVRSLFDLPRPK